jgi:hypothetical protein
MGGTWTTLVGSGGLIIAGLLMGNWFLHAEIKDDETKVR